jgi:hypothetical protein
MAESLQLLIKSTFDATGVTAASNSIRSIDGQLTRISGSFSRFMGLLGAGGIGAGLFAFGKSAVMAFAESEKGVSQLTKAMRNLGDFTQKDIQIQLDFAAELQKTTKYSDEQIMSIQSQLTTYGLYGEELKKATKATLDLSTQTGDVNAASKLVGKAYQGQIETLSRMGIKIKATGDTAKDFDAVMAELNRRFGGFAENEGRTFSGQVAIMTNRFDELKEKIGRELMPVANTWLTWIDKATTKMEGLFSRETDELKGIDLTIAGLKKKLEISTAYIKAAGERGLADDEQTKKEIQNQQKIIDALKRVRAQKSSQSDEEVPGVPKRKPVVEKSAEEIEARKKAQAYIQRATMTQEQISDIETQALADSLNKYHEHELAKEVLEAQYTAKVKAQNELRAANLNSTLSTISTLASSKNKELAAVGKTAAIAQASMDTYKAANVALGSAPPPFSFVLAAATVAAGLANVSKIMSFETGGSIKNTGPAFLHAGEFVLNKSTVDAIKSGTTPPKNGGSAVPAGRAISIQNNITLQSSAKEDVGPLCQKITEAVKNGIRQATDMSNAVVKVGTQRAGQSIL